METRLRRLHPPCIHVLAGAKACVQRSLRSRWNQECAPFHRRRLSAVALGAALLASALSGCATVRFYTQASAGQATLLLARRDVRTVLTAPETPPALASQLRLAQSMLRFAEQALALPVDGRYQSYVQMDGAAMWNVVAAEELALAAVPRCYPLVGCTIYRGYFSQRDAEREAARLAVEHDVHVYPVAAYSTLGWFDDPLLSSFIHWPEADLAELLFHELAHSVLYVRDDSTFNESYASFVGGEGAIAWLNAQGEDAEAHRRNRETRRQAARAFSGFLAHWRDRLVELYALPIAAAAKRQLKAEAFRAMQAAYRSCRERLGDGRHDDFMAVPLSNARLLAAGTYEDMQPGFARLFRATGKDWPTFFRRARELGSLPMAERHAALATNAQETPACVGEPNGGRLGRETPSGKVAGLVANHIE